MFLFVFFFYYWDCMYFNKLIMMMQSILSGRNRILRYSRLKFAIVYHGAVQRIVLQITNNAVCSTAGRWLPTTVPGIDRHYIYVSSPYFTLWYFSLNFFRKKIPPMVNFEQHQKLLIM